MGKTNPLKKANPLSKKKDNELQKEASLPHAQSETLTPFPPFSSPSSCLLAGGFKGGCKGFRGISRFLQTVFKIGQDVCSWEHNNPECQWYEPVPLCVCVCVCVCVCKSVVPVMMVILSAKNHSIPSLCLACVL